MHCEFHMLRLCMLYYSMNTKKSWIAHRSFFFSLFLSLVNSRSMRLEFYFHRPAWVVSFKPCHRKYHQRSLNEKTGNCTLILYKTNGQHAVLNAYYAPFPLFTWDAYYFTVNLVGGANVVWFVSLLIHRAIHTSLWTSQTSARSRSRARRVISYRCALIGEEMRALHCPIVR